MWWMLGSCWPKTNCVPHPESTGKISGIGWSTIGSSLADRARVKKERLCDVVGKDPYEVTNKHNDKYNPFPPSKIVQLAEKLVGREFCYRVLRANCEHFVNELRYGVSRSDQVIDAVPAAIIMKLNLLYKINPNIWVLRHFFNLFLAASRKVYNALLKLVKWALFLLYF
ncbi:PREDICTED: HRAS-like suppressor 3 isoform X2 [Bison bison bison]|uniref:HRAS-like suppressor 3 isoform X2 n=1 Tax=Bison bison bison TaxID=43346 RepID=A0A6P3GY39_BISBB|nr:PREDICTED: HRAS-like suppressor 3 isoform X2 [Bison bison bison]